MERLKELRTKRGLRQSDVAERLNIAPATLARYESGEREPGLKVLKQLADLYEVTVDYLLERTDDPSPFAPADADPYMAFGASLADGMDYNDLDTVQKAKLIDYYWLLRGQHPKNN